MGKSLLVIAHRLSTIIDSDKIIVLKNGLVIEEGTHSELIAKNGEYKMLWDTQTQERNIKTKEVSKLFIKLLFSIIGNSDI